MAIIIISALFSIFCLVSSIRNNMYSIQRVGVILSFIIVSALLLFLGEKSLVVFYPLMLMLINVLPLSSCFIIILYYGWFYWYMFASISGWLILPVLVIVAIIAVNEKRVYIINIASVVGVGVICVAYLIDSLITNCLITYDEIFMVSCLVLICNPIYLNSYTVPRFRKLVQKMERLFS